jgi:hypothetical protein
MKLSYVKTVTLSSRNCSELRRQLSEKSANLSGSFHAAFSQLSERKTAIKANNDKRFLETFRKIRKSIYTPKKRGCRT